MYVRLLSFLLFTCKIIPNESSVIDEARNSVGSETTLTTDPPIPEGYVIFPEDNAAYKIYEIPLTWNQARRRCTSEGARLAIADTVNKIVHINSLKTDLVLNWVHVGIRRLPDIDKWIRIDNGIPVFSLPWKSGNPDGTGNCAGISMTEDAIVDYGCNRSREYYACEISI